MISKAKDEKISRAASYLLRHGAVKEGILITPDGWVDIEDALNFLGCTRGALNFVVSSNVKQRFQVEGNRIRASQGHSMIVTPEALEASWTLFEGPGPIYHGTRFSVLESIAQEGLLPQSRTHVHMTDSLTSHVGKRAYVQVMLSVDPQALRDQGTQVYRSQNGVILARKVPIGAFIQVLVLVSGHQEQVQAIFPGLSVMQFA